MIYLDELHEDLLKTVKTTEGYLRVITGTGSGKTNLIVSRYVYLVSEYKSSLFGELFTFLCFRRFDFYHIFEYKFIGETCIYTSN